MKKLLSTIILLGLIYLIFLYHTPIIQFLMIHVIYKDQLFMPENSMYAKDQDWLFVQKTNDFYPKNRQDLLNLFYTALDNGLEEFTFYCDETYKECLDDMQILTNDNYILSNINNLVTTLNSYHRIYVNMNVLGRVHVQFEHTYTEDQKLEIETKVNQLYEELISPNMTDEEKIRTIHDYIIENTVYDQNRSEYIDTSNPFYVTTSSTAYGPLFTGEAVCGGYTDAMALFLDKMGLPNYKIASDNHIWNFVYVDGAWKHLDLTWDDPVNSKMNYNFFLISTDTLKQLDRTEHTFDSSIYLEAK